MYYICGNCWCNMKLTNNCKLSEIDLKIYDIINEIVNNVKELTYPITLFHGFEKFTNYDENNWHIGDAILFKGFLSKTPSFDVANNFARMYNFFNRKILVVKYPIGSKHIGMNIRHPDDQEYEYLTKSNEKLKLIDIYRKIKFFSIVTFYICEDLN